MGCAGESAQPIIIMYGGRGLADEGFAAGDGLLVEGDEVVVTLGQGLFEAADDGICPLDTSEATYEKKMIELS